MTNLVRWDPFTEMRSTMDRLYGGAFPRPRRVFTAEYEATFPVEVSETDHEIEVKASLPGVKPEEVDISISNDVLTIKAEHKETTEETKREFHRREIRYGAYHRSFNLPVSVDADKAEAHFENGLLTLRLPKSEALRPRQIKVSTGSVPSDGASTVS